MSVVSCLMGVHWIMHDGWLIPTTWVVGFTTGGRIFAVFQFSQRISRSADSLCICLLAFYIPFDSRWSVQAREKKGACASLYWLVCFVAQSLTFCSCAFRLLSSVALQVPSCLVFVFQELMQTFLLWDMECWQGHICNVYPGIQKGGPNPWNHLLLVGSSRWGLLMAWKSLRDQISQCTLV